MKKILKILLTLCALTAPVLSEDAFLQIANIQGEVVIKGREGQMEVLAFSHELSTPIDTATGQPSGKRQHSPLRVVLRHNKGTPLLAKALTDNTPIPEIKLLLWQPDTSASPGTGVERQYFTYTFKNCRVTGMRAWMPNKLDRDTSTYVPAVEVSFVYQSINWFFVSGGVTHEDSWSTGGR